MVVCERPRVTPLLQGAHSLETATYRIHNPRLIGDAIVKVFVLLMAKSAVSLVMHVRPARE